MSRRLAVLRSLVEKGSATSLELEDRLDAAGHARHWWTPPAWFLLGALRREGLVVSCMANGRRWWIATAEGISRIEDS